MSDNEAAGAIADNMTKVQGELATLDRIEAGFAALVKLHPADVLIDVTTSRGMKDALAARAAWRDPRIAVEKARKAAKSPVLELGRAIDKRAAELTGRLEVGELHYDGQIKAEEARKEAERLAKVEAEAQRLAAIQSALEGIRERGADAANLALCPTAEAIQQEIAGLVALAITPAVYQEAIEQAAQLKDATLASMRRLHASALDREAEAARIAAEREELARLRAEQEARDRVERERVAVEQKAEAERLAAERAQLEEQQRVARAEQARLDTEAAAERRRADEAAAAARAKQDRLASERREAEERAARAAHAAEQRRLNEQAAALRREQEAAAEARRAQVEREELAKWEANKAAARVRDAAPAMRDALKQWRNAEDMGDSDELAAARAARDAALEAAGELLDIPY